MEDGREIFDDDLDDDVVEDRKGKQSVQSRPCCIVSVLNNQENLLISKGLSFCEMFAGRAGAKGPDAKKNVKKSVVAKPNTIKSLFMNSNVKRPAEVCFCLHHRHH